MARLTLWTFRRFSPNKISTFTFALFFLLLCAGLAAAASTPPTGENAYCGKGDVAHFGDKDGPAELPKTCYYTALDGTPSPGKRIHVAANEKLAEAVDRAQCGDTLLLPAGATFEVASLPYKKCDAAHYITIRTDTPDSKLPPEGSRISPAWAGIASLPGRPQFAQPAGGPGKLLATIMVKQNTGVVVGDHVRFLGIEWTTRADTPVTRMISTEHGERIIFDRNYIHAGEGAEVAHGVGMVQGSHYIAVIDSYISQLTCIAVSGKCTDATGMGGAHSDDPFGTFKIYNNFIEAAGEDILFGGGGSENNPTDIEIRRNHLFRPMLWKQDEPGYTAPSSSGHPFVVKNNLELKSGVRVLIEANLLENSWGGFSQRGFSILLTPASQSSHCPKCRVTDVTLRYDRVRNAGGVFAFAMTLAPEAKGRGSAEDGGRFSIHDLIADDIHGEDYHGGGTFLKEAFAQNHIHDVQMDHITSFSPGALLVVHNRGDKTPNFAITNSVLAVGGDPQPLHVGGPGSCGQQAQRAGAKAFLDDCFSSYRFDHNLIAAPRGAGWPANNIVVASPKDLGVHDLKDGKSADPRLCHAEGPGCSKRSPGVGAASDGRDIGADVEAVAAALAGVE